MFGSLAAKASAFESKLVLYIIAGVVALVIVNLLLDGIRKFIRGLDTAALGALLIFLGYKASEFKLVSVLTNLLYLIGGTLFVLGILIFIIMSMIRKKRSATRSGPPMPKEQPSKDKNPEEPRHEAPKPEGPKHAAKE
jgi:hypothetical protein